MRHSIQILPPFPSHPQTLGGVFYILCQLRGGLESPSTPDPKISLLAKEFKQNHASFNTNPSSSYVPIDKPPADIERCIQILYNSSQGPVHEAYQIRGLSDKKRRLIIRGSKSVLCRCVVCKLFTHVKTLCLQRLPSDLLLPGFGLASIPQSDVRSGICGD
jgi:hypothetical protein